MGAIQKQTNGDYYSEIKGSVQCFYLLQDVSSIIGNNLMVEIYDALDANPAVTVFAILLRDRFTIDSHALRGMGRALTALKKAGATVHLLEADRATKSLIADLDMGSVLLTGATLEELTGTAKSAGPKPTAINVEFINPFIDGAVKTLEVQCSLPCKAGKPMLKESAEPASYEITGVIGITSDAFTGSIAICFPAAVFLGAMSGMLGEECKEITKDLEDGAGELLNIIFGHAKTVLNEKGFALAKAIPTVIRGKNIEVKHLTLSKTILLPFETKFGCFYIEIGTEPVSI